MRLALIGDIHTFSPRIHPKRVLMSKRIVGHTNMLAQSRRFDHDLLDPLFARVRSIGPDVALFSGDVSNTSHEDEFDDIAEYLRPLADEMEVVIVPGNHDRYTFGSRRSRRIERLMQGLLPEAFPELRRLNDRWKLLALDAGLPQVVMSRGRLGNRQYVAARRHIRSLVAGEGLVVLCHYPVALPPRFPNSFMHDMVEAKRLAQELADCPARVLYLHGHIHKPWHLEAVQERGKTMLGRPKKLLRAMPFECINAGAPCMTGTAFPGGQGFWQIDLPDDPHDPLGVTHHVPRPPAGGRELEWESRQA